MKLKLIEQKLEVPGIHTFIFEPDQPITWQPGQYMHYTLNHPQADSRGLERWFTIASAPYEKHIQITTRIIENDASSFKKALLKFRPGDTLEADGPKGKFTLREGASRHVLIAGGIGITPFHSMLKQLSHDGKAANADLLYANSDEHFAFAEEFAKFAAADSSLRIFKFAGSRIDEKTLAGYLADKSVVFYLSGPEAMVQAYEGMLHLMKVDESRVATDYFPGY